MKHKNKHKKKVCSICHKKKGLAIYWGWCEECWEKSLDDINYGLNKEDNFLTDNE